MPDFLIIGAGKSGTTSLDYYLQSHPEVYMCPVKEPNFFALEGEAMVDEKDDPERLYHYPWSVTALDKYQALFEEAPAGAIKGDVSPMYMYGTKAPANIKRYIPDVKLIAILRQPAERLYSRYLHLAREDALPTSGFSDCLDRSSIWWRRNDLVQEGFYYTHLSRYFEMFPAEQIKVFLYDDIREDLQKSMHDLFDFLGVDQDVELDYSIQLNQSGFIKSKWKDKLIGQRSIVKYIMEKTAPALYNKLRNSNLLKKKIQNLRGKNLEKPGIEPRVYNKLTTEVYGEEIKNLQQLLQRDLSHWMQEKPE